MSTWLIAIVTVLYAGVALAYWREKNPGMALAFAGYAVANVGLIWATRSLMSNQ